MSSTNCVPKKITKRRYTRRNSCKNVENHLTVVDTPPPTETKSLPIAEELQPSRKAEVEWLHKQAYSFMKCFKHDYKHFTNLYKCVLHEEQEKEQRNIRELDELKKEYIRLQAEETEMKRKRWCRYCQSEAIYLSSTSTNFYCSKKCEQKHFFNVQEPFNASL